MYPYQHAEVEHLRMVVQQLRIGGRDDVAESLVELLAALEHMGRTGSTLLTLSTGEPLPGWRAAAFFAGQEPYRPTCPRVGDRVRLTYGDGSTVTGEWRYDTTDGDDDHPNGRPYVLSDADAEQHFHVTGPARRDVTRMGHPADGWDRSLADAATIVHSAWTASPRAADVAVGGDVDPLDECFGCGGYADGKLVCVAAEDCTAAHVRRGRHHKTRWCVLCGHEATARVTAWIPVVQVVAAALERDTDVAFDEPRMLAGASVCGATCAQLWVRQTRDLPRWGGMETRDQLMWRLDTGWRYEPDDGDLPPALYAAVRAARTAEAHLVRLSTDVLRADYDNSATSVRLVREQASLLLDAALALDADLDEETGTPHAGDDSRIANR